MLTFAIVVLVVVAGSALVLLGWLGMTEFAERSLARRQQRVTAESREAEWRLQQLSRAAFERMLDEVRRQS
jgi:O-antigen ligase